VGSILEIILKVYNVQDPFHKTSQFVPWLVITDYYHGSEKRKKETGG
jgi:hypothetical protein